MKKVNYAAIDIGSNAVRLLIKSVNEEGSPEGLLSKVQLIRIPLRLGEDDPADESLQATDEDIRSVRLPRLCHLGHA